MRRSAVLPEIEKLDPLKDHQRIVFLSMRVDFPWDTTRALEFALFRTYCVPAISGLLDKTQEFCMRPQKRYDDTDIIISEIIECGYDNERGIRAIRRMNQIHGRFKISNDDFLYVLSTFIYEPIRWNARFGWRKMIEKEKQAMFYFWREVGRRMNIRNIPETYEGFEQFNVEYERANYKYSPANHTIGRATCRLFMSWFPPFSRPLVKHGIYAMMDDPLLTAFGFPKPAPWLRHAANVALQWRGRLQRLLPSRRSPLLRTHMKHRSYPEGYTIERVGPPPYTVSGS